MAVRLQVAQELVVGPTVLRALGGHLDEGFDQATLDPHGCTHMVLDLGHVDKLTSAGVRDWIRAVREVRKRVEGLYFVDASPRITDQFNMVVGFDGGGSLLSFLAYYQCDGCGEQSPHLFDTQLDRTAFDSIQAPPRQCGICGREAELDDDPSILFEYARSTTPAPPPAVVLGALRHADSWVQDVPGVRLTMRPVVEGDTTRVRLAGIVDRSFPGRQIAELDGARFVFDLQYVAHFDASSFERWRTAFQTLSKKSPVRFTACSPVVLRRFAEDPSLLGGATIDTVVFPGHCAKCQTNSWYSVELGSLDDWIASRPECEDCKSALDVRERLADFRTFIAALAAPRIARQAPPQAQAVAARPARPASPQAAAAPSAAAAHGFAEKYEVLSKLGEGGMAEVHLVRQHGAMGFRRLAVVKTIRSEWLTDDRMIRLFLDEAKLVARIDHPNIIRVYDLERVDGAFCMVLEFVHGRTVGDIMGQVVRHNARVPARIAATIVADLCKALARAHMPDSNGAVLVHRDITSNNVLVSFDGIVKLVDFGLAGFQHGRAWGNATILGSPPWLAPEIFLGNKATPQADIWGAGLLLASMLAGTNPFHRGTTEATARAVVHESPMHPALVAKIPEAIMPIIEKGLAKDLDRRYCDAAVMETELRAAIPALEPCEELGPWLRAQFADLAGVERAFAKQCGETSLIDALLKVQPDAATRFFGELGKQPFAQVQTQQT